MDNGVRLRFAPSPTGHLHIGGARTALFNWLIARKFGGRFILRLEDTDQERSRREFEDEILRDLEWLGLTWDEGPGTGGPYGPYRQTERFEIYREAAERLLASGHAYRCTCSEDRLEALRRDAMATGRKPGYDGHCRDLGLGPDCGPHVIRFRMPDDGEIEMDDLVKGHVVVRNEELEDLVLIRTDGLPTYNYVVVVDDWSMGITHVLRGDDHLNNTPKQIQIYRALGATPPRFGHMPLILGGDGKRLSKRHGATSVGSYREMGYLAPALINYLARLGWSHGDMELFSTEEVLQVFDVADIGKSAGRWDPDKLLWVNQHWLQRLPLEEVGRQARPFLEARGVVDADDRITAAAGTVRGRSRTLVELAEQAMFYFVDDEALELDAAAARKFLTPETAELMDAMATLLDGAPEWRREALEPRVTAWMGERGLGLGAIAQPVRVSVTGRKIGPGLFETLEVLGKERSMKRIRMGVARARGQA